MNAAVAVFLFACVATAVVADDAINAQIAEITKTCAVAHKIAPEQLAVLRSTADKATIAATEELKCFAKCAIESSQFVRDGAIDVERVVAVSVAHGKDGAKVRTNAAKCALAGDLDCNAAWELYRCFHQ